MNWADWCRDSSGGDLCALYSIHNLFDGEISDFVRNFYVSPYGSDFSHHGGSGYVPWSGNRIFWKFFHGPEIFESVRWWNRVKRREKDVSMQTSSSDDGITDGNLSDDTRYKSGLWNQAGCGGCQKEGHQFGDGEEKG